jgi:hypothetical protein
MRWSFEIRSPIDMVVKPRAVIENDFHLIDAFNWIGILPHSRWDTVEMVCDTLLRRYHPDRGEGSDPRLFDLTQKSRDMLREHKHLFTNVPR